MYVIIIVIVIRIIIIVIIIIIIIIIVILLLLLLFLRTALVCLRGTRSRQGRRANVQENDLEFDKGLARLTWTL